MATLARAGTQMGEEVQALEKRVPEAANRSKFGVRMNEFPEQPMYLGSCSSEKMNSVFAGFKIDPSERRAVAQLISHAPERRSA